MVEGELAEASVVKEYLTTAADGKSHRTKLYNLDMILAVGYRVRSLRGTQFRRWATMQLREYLVKGFVMDDARLKKPGGWDYFDLDYAEDQAKRRKTVTMQEWEDKLGAFVSFNERDVLTHAGKVRAELAEKLALERYGQFDTARRLAERMAADEEDMADLERLGKTMDQKKPK